MPTDSASAPIGPRDSAPTTAVAPNTNVEVVQQIVDEVPAQEIVNSVYTVCRIVARWVDDYHTAALAPTDTGGEVALVALAAPTLQLTVEYVVERVGAQPAVPASDLGPNFVLHRREHAPAEPVVDGNRAVSWRATGWMTFTVRHPRKVNRGAPLPPDILDRLAAVPGGDKLLVKELALAKSGPVEDKRLLPFAKPQ